MSKDSGTDILSRVLGGTAIAGCLIAIILDFVGIGLSEKVGIISGTISDLAAAKAGRETMVDDLADIGLFAFVISVLATGAGLLRWRIERLDWKLGVVALSIVAVCVTLIAGYEAYTTGNGPVIHYRLVYALGIAFPLAVLLTAGQFWEISRPLGIALYVGGVIWAILGPFLFIIPTEYDGGYERMLAALMMLWFVTMGVMIWDDPDIAHHVSDDQRS